MPLHSLHNYVLWLQEIGLGNSIKGDNTWPAALHLSFFWPLCFPIAVLTKNYLIQQGYVGYALTGLCLSGFAWIMLVAGSVFYYLEVEAHGFNSGNKVIII